MSHLTRTQIPRLTPDFDRVHLYLDERGIPEVDIAQGALRAQLEQLGVVFEGARSLTTAILRACMLIALDTWDQGRVGKNTLVSVRWGRLQHREGYRHGRMRRPIHRTHLFSDSIERELGLSVELLQLLGITEDMDVSATIAYGKRSVRVLNIWGKMDFPDTQLLEDIEGMCGCATADDRHLVFLDVVRLWSAALRRLRVAVREDSNEDPVMRILFYRLNRVIVFKGRRLEEIIHSHHEW